MEPRAKEFFEKAQAHIAALPKPTNGQKLALPVVTRNAKNYYAWRQYFELHLGYTPPTFKRLERDESASFTVPCEWPSWLDSTFLEDKTWRPAEAMPAPRRVRESLEQLKARHGPNWGLGSIKQEIKRPTGVFDRANAVTLAREASDEELQKDIPVSDELRRKLHHREAAEWPTSGPSS